MFCHWELYNKKSGHTMKPKTQTKCRKNNAEDIGNLHAMLYTPISNNNIRKF
jgi:hypothetical protein